MFFWGEFFAIKKMILGTTKVFVLNKIGPDSPNFEFNFFVKFKKSPDFYNKFWPRAPSLHQAVKISKDLKIYICTFVSGL